MKPIICLAAVMLAAVAQPAPQFRVSFSHQPLEVFKAAFITKLPSVAMYEATVCNVGQAPGSVSGGLVLQAANSRLNTISRNLVEMTALRARTKSKKYVAMEVLKWSSIVGSMLVTGGTIDLSSTWGVVFPIMTAASDRLSKQWDEKSISTSTMGGWLAADEAYTLAPSGCSSRLFLGRYERDFQPFTLEIK